MVSLIHRTPSVGGIIKKLHESYPGLNIREIADIIRQSTGELGDEGGRDVGEFSQAFVVDESRAIQLAKAYSQKK